MRPPRIKELRKTYEDLSEDVPLTGITTDAALLAMFDHVCEQARTQWFMRQAGTLPEGFKLVQTVTLLGLEGRNHSKIGAPLVEAAMAWAGMSLDEQEYVAQEWRAVGPERVVRVKVTHPRAVLVRTKPYVPDPGRIHIPALATAQPLGPSSPYPRRG